MSILEIQLTEEFGVGLIHGQQVVACSAVIGDRLAIFGGVVPVMAAEATRGVIVPDVIRVRPPRDLHLWKYILLVDGGKGCGGLINLGELAVPDCWKSLAIEVLETPPDLSGGLHLRWHTSPESTASLAYGRRVEMDRACRWPSIHRQRPPQFDVNELPGCGSLYNPLSGVHL
jgi:hypothetical protein